MTNWDSELSFNAADLDLRQAAQALQTWGVICLRQALPSGSLTTMAQQTQNAFAHRNQQLENGTLPDIYEKHARIGYVNFLPLEESSPVGQQPLWLLECLQLSPVAWLLQAHFGGDFLVFMSATVCRQQSMTRPQMLVPFHQEGPFMDTDLGALNCWIPLTDCGVHSPGLEVLPQKSRQALATRLDLGEVTASAKGYDKVEIPEHIIQEHFAHTPPWRPLLQVGDALLFDHWCVHRTAWTTAMNETRYSAEIRTIGGTQPPFGYEALPFYPIHSVGFF